MVRVGLAASRHGALHVHVLRTAAVSMHVHTWHVFTDGGGATATSEGAAGVGIAIVPPAAAQRQQLILRGERLETIAEASAQTRARTSNEAEVIAATRSLRLIAAGSSF